MTPRIFAYIRHHEGVLDDSAVELTIVAKKIDPSLPLTAVITGSGDLLQRACESARALYQEVWKIDNPALEHLTPELVSAVLSRVFPEPAIVLISHDHFGLDVGPGLAVKLDAAYLPDIVGIDGLSQSSLRVVRQEFAGQINTHVHCDIAHGAVITVRPGAFRASEQVPLSGVIMTKIVEPPRCKSRRYIDTIRAAAGEIDITKYDLLVSVGRGIQNQDNLPVVQELADVLGAALSCSRPVVDAKWLDKSRQVGSSGKTVKPRVYLACGISGQFQHLAGLKGSPFIIAVNKNPKAPIFQVADVGVVADLLEFLPHLTELARVEQTKRLTVA